MVPADRRRRVPFVLVVALALVGLSCSVDRALPPPSCLSGDSGLIVAQSVPGAELVPCLGELPAGWSVDAVDITESGTHIRFDSDRAGESAARLHYENSCDPGPAVAIPVGPEGTDAFESIERLQPGFKGSRYFTFRGGCVWWEFDFDDGVSAALSVDLGTSLELVTRVAVNEGIRESFIDEEL